MSDIAAALADFRGRRWRDVVDRLAPIIDGCRDLDAIRIFALSLSELGQHAAAIELLRQAVALFPHAAVAHINLATALRRGGDPAGAESALCTALQLDPDSSAAFYNLGNLLKSQARLGEARAPLERALALAPDRVDARVLLGEVLKALGEIEAAVAQFRAAIARQPHCGAAWWGIANLKTGLLDRDDLRTLDALWAGAVPAAERATIGFARASAHAQHSDPETAWAALEQANAEVAAVRPFDRARYHSELARARAALPLVRAAAVPATEAVFIVGMPRSGSTLLEQMLAAHPRLAACSELPDLPALVAQQRRAHGEDWRARIDDVGWRALGAAYLERSARWRGGGRIGIDKLPENFLYSDVILRMLPGARIIDCRRDARDCALSCLQQYFAYGHAFSYALSSIADYHVGYRALMTEVARAAPGRVACLRYEDLVAAPEETLRVLLDFLALEFEPACLRPEQVRREVRTASAAQVIAPLDQRGVGRWRRHARQFANWNEEGIDPVLTPS